MVCARRLFCLRCAILPQPPVSGNFVFFMLRPLRPALAAALVLRAGVYNGDLYLPKESDRARFAPVQTGLQFSPIAPMPDVEPQPLPADK